MEEIRFQSLLHLLDDDNKSEGVDFSLVVMAHREGIVAHKTMIDCLLGLEKVVAKGYSFELIIHINCGDRKTLDYFDRFKKYSKVKICINDFKGEDEVRNFVSLAAKGKYVAFMNAGDLISPDYYVKALARMSNTDETIILHANAILEFGVYYPNILKIERSYSDRQQCIMDLLGGDIWDSAIVVSRKVLINYPYSRGDSNYVFNVETMDGGVEHEVVEGTVLFRRKPMDAFSIRNIFY